jgi:hypothetical protein
MFPSSSAALRHAARRRKFDGTAWSQKNPAKGPQPRYGHAMAYDAGRGVTVLFGGFDTDRDAETWEWTGALWLQKFVLTLPTPRSGHAMAYDSRRGSPSSSAEKRQQYFSDETWKWDGTAWTSNARAVAAAGGHAWSSTLRNVAVLFAVGPGAPARSMTPGSTTATSGPCDCPPQAGKQTARHGL